MNGNLRSSLLRPRWALLLAPVLLLAAPACWAESITSEVRVASILVNGLVRIAAIAAGTYVVWLGHNTLVRGVKGEFNFEGPHWRLKGSTPGLLFVLLGCLVIGWALATRHYGEETVAPEVEASAGNVPGSSVSPPMPPIPPVPTIPAPEAGPVQGKPPGGES